MSKVSHAVAILRRHKYVSTFHTNPMIIFLEELFHVFQQLKTIITKDMIFKNKSVTHILKKCTLYSLNSEKALRVSFFEFYNSEVSPQGEIIK